MKATIPLFPTLLVAASVLLMIRLGVWQLDRRHEKEALIVRYAANAARPPMALPALWPIRETDLFRRVAAECLTVARWRAEVGRSTAGATGWRHLATCRTGAEGPGFIADMGESSSIAPPRWNGGPVRGRLAWAPTGEPLVARLFRPAAAPMPLIVADNAAPALAPSIQPDPTTVPNNHLGYAVQWFLFAGVAVIVYAAALWRRRPVAPPPRGR